MKTISYTDPALDPDMKLTEFLDTRDESLIKLLPGRRATWFTLGRIDYLGFTTYVNAAPLNTEKFARAFELGVTGIEAVLEDGRIESLRPELEEPVGSGRVRMRWSNAQFDDLAERGVVSYAALFEIGQLCYTGELLGKGRVHRWPWPPGSVHVLEAMRQTSPRAAAREEPPPSAASSED